MSAVRLMVPTHLSACGHLPAPWQGGAQAGRLGPKGVPLREALLGGRSFETPELPPIDNPGVRAYIFSAQKGQASMVIDCHSHLVPKSWYDSKSPQAIFNIEGLLEEQEKAGVDITVFGNNWIRNPEGKDSLEIMKEFNVFAAEATAKYPKHLVGLVSSIPFADDRILKETKRAISDYKLKGIMVNSSVNGEYLDSPRATPFFELVTELDVPLFIHPPRVTIGAEKMEIFRLPEMVGRPFDTTLSLTRFIFAGGLEKFPNLNLICAHVGGALPLLPGRLDFGYELRKDMSFGPWEPDVMTRPPSSYIRQLYFDTVSLHPPAVLCAVQTVGADHVLFGSDFPPVPIPLKRSLEAVTSVSLSSEEKEKILGGNAARLLGLSG
ncbi:MAG: amidohydrolase [Deltaproteobacteria bacterium]|nr:amidohydrolase [Deltaproteobacteria bacterium]